MSDSVEDRRSLRSRRLLWEALLAMLQTEDWAEITVQKICDQADVARSTFYAHYQTKQDLLDAGFALGLQEINRQIAALPATPDRLHSLDWLVAHMSNSQGFQRRLQGSSAGFAIMLRFRAMTSDLMRRDLQRLGQPASEQGLTFVMGGLFAATEGWLATGCREPQAALIRRLRLQIDAVLAAETF